MDVINTAVEWAVKIAEDPAHGYDQRNRWGETGDYDCSSLVISAFKTAGLPLTSHYTGTMKADFLANGFVLVTDGTRRRGDVLLSHNAKFQHTALMIDGARLVQASQNENGGIVGGVPGDQTGHEINISPYYEPYGGWDYVLRFNANNLAAEPEAMQETYTVKGGDTLYGIAARFGLSVYDIAKWNGIQDANLIYAGAVLRLMPPTEEKPDFECDECRVILPEEEPKANNTWEEGFTAEDGSDSEEIYTVKAGDTLSGIAYVKYGRWNYYQYIKEANGLTSDKILVGQKIKLPSKQQLIGRFL